MKKRQFAVVGMMCAGCAANVERTLSKQEGVGMANVNLAGRTVLIEYDEQKTSPETLKEALDKTGYELVIDETKNTDEIEARRMKQLKRKTAISSGFVLLIMYLSMRGNSSYNNQLMMIAALLCLVYCGREFYVNAFRQLLHRSANMDTLVALSTAVSFLFSAFNTFWGDRFWGSRGIEWHTYFDASVMIVWFVLLGRLLEERAKNSTARSIRSMMALQPKTARLVENGETHDVPLSTVQPGDTIEVHVGEKVPVDGVLLGKDAVASIDESMMTGEAMPAEKRVGDKLLAGTMVRSGEFRMKAQEVGRKTVLAGMIRAVEEAQSSKAPVQRTVDKIALYFVPTVMALSLLTFVVWVVAGGTSQLPRAILSAVSVLVIACPCAMGLATPTALMVGIGKAAEKNILIKDASALEQLRKTNALVIDKTGTLTQTEDGEETLKPHARDAIDALKRKGVEVYMMSGDREESASKWARAAGIDHYKAKALPQDKEDLVRRLQREGKTVAMVGDGINDSQALAAADVSIAIGRGTDVAMDVAGATLMTADLRRLPEAIELSRKTVGMIRQNLFWAFIYNMVCIPLAAGALRIVGIDFQITPQWAAALMAMSSVSVVLNSLRLRYLATAILIVCSTATLSAQAPDTLFRERPIPDSIFTVMQGKSYPKGCTVRRSDLRYVEVSHYDGEGNIRRGEIVCSRLIAADLIDIFRELFRQRYPIERIRLIDRYDADDERSMRANNTSAFCYRTIAKGKKLSYHARGLAIDINPLYNPYVRRRKNGTLLIQPSTGKPYTDRSRKFPYKITTQDLCYRLFLKHGFRWGGSWRTLKDYQHFEKRL